MVCGIVGEWDIGGLMLRSVDKEDVGSGMRSVGCGVDMRLSGVSVVGECNMAGDVSKDNGGEVGLGKELGAAELLIVLYGKWS